MRSNSIHVTDVSKIPSGEHWAIIENTTISHEGDERSRTNPGHGYPAYTESAITYTAYTNKEEFEADLKLSLSNRGYARRPVRGIHVSGIFTSEVVIQLQET